MKAIRVILACIRKADQKFNLINNGDKIIVGFSGGKDSMALVYALSLYQKFSHVNFKIQPVTLDLGFPGFDEKPLKEFCDSIGLNLIIKDCKDVYKILSIQQKNHKHLPCSICSRMKKAAINKVANEMGYNKVAFAHHADDAIETLLMNEIYGGRIATFSPKMHLQKADITFIRPLILVKEKDIKTLIKEEKFDIIPSHCPSDHLTTREDVKSTLESIYKAYPTSKENFLSMLDNYQKNDIWDKQISLQVNQDGLTIVPVVTPLQNAIYLNIRHLVFVDEIGINYKDEVKIDEEEISNSYLIYLNETPIGTVRYIQKEEIQIGRLAILKKYRNKSYGTEVINFLSEYLWSIYNPKTIYVNAMKKYQNFYEKCSYKAIGKTFKEVNIPHIKMIYTK